MRTYRVEFSEPAELELDAAYLNRSRFTSPEEAVRWFDELDRQIHGLAEGPRRWQRIEAYGGESGAEVRRLLYGRGGGTWHVVYQVIEPAEGEAEEAEGIVRILHVVSAVRRPPGQAGQEGEERE